VGIDAAPAPKKEMPKPKSGESASVAPATITVSLPAEAKLFVDDTLTSSTSGVRTFESPALAIGAEYNYTLKAEIVREGKTVTATKQVAVRAGQLTSVAIDFPVATVAAK
jgi:uncharacterized protein (TIGR03000 family)